MAMKTGQTDAFWQSFVQQTGHSGSDYQVVAFGDNAEMATELAALVIEGRKRAPKRL